MVDQVVAVDEDDFDVLIVGAGFAGLSLAKALSGLGLKLGLIESKPLPADAPVKGAETAKSSDRSIALSYGSRLFFEQIGVWDQLQTFAEPILNIHISERGQFGFARLSAQEMQTPALGYVILAADLGRELSKSALNLPNLTLIRPASVENLHASPSNCQLVVRTADTSRQLSARLVVAADGGQSKVRELLKLPLRQWNYHQVALTATIETNQAHCNRAFERFTKSGPMAMLPLAGGYKNALVWTVPQAQAEWAICLDDEQFLIEAQQRFGYRLGQFVRVGPRHAHPLHMTLAKKSIGPRTAVVGNAAHSLHPVAGQGLNLGLRDLAVLIALIKAAEAKQQDIGSETLLESYHRQRTADQGSVTYLTDALVRVFTNPLLPVRWARNLGMLGLDLLTPARRELTKAAMGLHVQPKISSGA